MIKKDIINIPKVEEAVKAAASKVKTFILNDDEQVIDPLTGKTVGTNDPAPLQCEPKRIDKESVVPITERITEIVDPKKCAELTQRMEGDGSVPKVEETPPNDYEYVEHPNHYNEYDIETIDMMRRIWGNEQTAIWCKLTAFKYRTRMGLKPDNDVMQDLKKEQWYLQKYHELSPL